LRINFYSRQVQVADQLKKLAVDVQGIGLFRSSGRPQKRKGGSHAQPLHQGPYWPADAAAIRKRLSVLEYPFKRAVNDGGEVFRGGSRWHGQASEAETTDQHNCDFAMRSLIRSLWQACRTRQPCLSLLP
jgi:hypothetical protein